jgi:hypothetical protein
MIGVNKRGKPIMFFRNKDMLVTSEFNNRVLKRPDLFVHTKTTAMIPELSSIPVYVVKEHQLRRAIRRTKAGKL